MTNLSIQPSGAGANSAFFLNVWSTALFRPSVQAYGKMLDDAHATRSTAYNWMWRVAVPGALAAALVHRRSNAGWVWQPGGWIWLAALELVVFAVSTGILFGLGRLFRGTGSYAHFVYISAAFTAPLYLLGILLSLFLPTGNGWMFLWMFPFSLYASALAVVAVKAVHKFSWTRAILTVVLPGALINCADIILFGGILSALGPTIVLFYPVP